MEMKNIKAGYQKSIVTVDSIRFEKGKIYTLIGPNGSGKSTFLLSLSGILPLIDGTINTEGKSLSDIVAFVDTAPLTTDYLKVVDVLKMGRYQYTNLWHKMTPEDWSVVEKWSVQLGLKELWESPVSHMSDGQKQLIMIARALIEETPLIVMDEPTAFLDVPNTIEVMQIMMRAAQEYQKTIIFSSHDIGAALQVSDYVLWIKKGQLFVQSNESQKIPLSSIFDLPDDMLDANSGLFNLKKGQDA